MNRPDIDRLMQGIPPDVFHKDDGLRIYSLSDHLLRKHKHKSTMDPSAAPQAIDPAKVADTEGASNTSAHHWGFKGWLASLNIGGELAGRLEDHLCGPSSVQAKDRDSFLLRFFWLMKANHTDEGAGKNALMTLLERCGALEALSEALWKGGMELADAAAETGKQLSDKFAMNEGTLELSFGSLSDFFGGLEGFIGPPDANLRAAMEREHCQKKDAAENFETLNYGVSTTPRTEWLFAAGCQDQPPDGGWPVETHSCDHPREYKKRKWLLDGMAIVNQKLANQGEPKLCEEEAIGLRLYTGPMFQKYNGILRALALKRKVDKLKKELEEDSTKHSEHDKAENNFAHFKKFLDADNWYTTTIHVINSGLVKLGKVQKAVKVYRGFNGVLPPAFWFPNAWGVCGGTEMGFLSTTTNRAVAMAYAASGDTRRGPGTLFEVQMGMVDRGADLSWISQYPEEKELCFPPLTGLQVVSTRVEKSVLVLEARLNINLVSATIEDVVAKRFKTVAKLCDELEEEVTVLAVKAEGKWTEALDALGIAEDLRTPEMLQNASHDVRAQIRSIFEKDVLLTTGAGQPDSTSASEAQQRMNDNDTFLEAVRSAVEAKRYFQEPTLEWTKSFRHLVTKLQLGTLTKHLRKSPHHLLVSMTDSNVTHIDTQGCADLSSVSDETVVEFSTKAAITIAEKCPHLHTVNLAGCEALTNKAVRALASHCAGLRDISFGCCYKLTNEGVKALASHCAGLRDISFARCDKLTDEGVTALASHCAGLRDISFENCFRVTDEGVIVLASHCAGLRDITLGGCKLTNEGVKALASRCAGLRDINFKDCDELTDEGVKALASHCAGLRDISFWGCKQLTDEGVKALVSGCTGLRDVNFGFCRKLTDEGVTALASGCTGLRYVSFEDCCNLTDKSVRKLVEQFPDLKKADFSWITSITKQAKRYATQLRPNCEFSFSKG